MTFNSVSSVDLEFLRQLLVTHPSIDAAALYGSAARGDTEEHSDIDLLIVCRSTQKLPIFNDVQQALSKAVDRLSLTLYTEREIRFLQSVRSLFLLHLSREAVLLFDKTQFLGSVLAKFQPKRSYRQDFQQSLGLLDPLAAIVMQAPNNIHRLSYIYSLYRVFGVYLLAENEIYEFSKSRMTQMLMDQFPDQRQSIELLSALRVLNSNFFTGGLAGDLGQTSENSVIQMGRALASLAGTKLDITRVSYKDAVQLFIAAASKRERGLNYRLRMWLLLLIYDGLNLHLARVGEPPLTDLSELGLGKLTGSGYPQAISTASSEALHYLQRYPLKYFLSEDSKINKEWASHVLCCICEELAQGC